MSEENIGTRAFNIGTLSAGNNYEITLNTANTFEITKRDIANVDIAAIANQAYTSNAITPTLTVSDNNALGLSIVSGDYTVSFTNNTNVGQATATITATAGGNYSGTKTANFNIIPNLDFAEISVSSTHIYNGIAQEPTFTASIGSANLVAGTDFTASFSNNINAGTATITITGTGNYSGEATETFIIAPRQINITPNTGQTKVFGEADPTFEFTPSEPLIAGNAFSGALARAAGNNVETYAFTIGNLSAGSNYELSFIAGNTFAITPRNISNATIAAIADQAYTRNAITPTLTVSDNAISPLGIVASDYDVSFSNNTNVGTATATITATGNYTGTTSANFQITPAALSWSTTGTVNNKIYDGNNEATVLTAPTLLGIIAGDDITVGTGSVIFNSVNVANGIGITASGWGVGGTHAGNYTHPIGQPVFAAANITARPLVVGFTAENKVYNGNNTAAIATRFIVSGLATTDNDTEVLVQGGTATFNNANAANGKTVSATGFTLGGTKAGNYTIQTIETATANITPAPLTITADDKTTTFRSAAPTFTATISGFVNNETESVLGGTLAFTTDYDHTATPPSPVGTYNITPSGLTSTNYAINFVAGTLTVGEMSLNDAVITVSGAYTYTGVAQTPTFSVAIGTVNLVAGTDFTAGFTNNINAGTATITITAAGNFTGSATQTFEIDKRGLTLSGGTSAAKTFDGNRNATITAVNFVGLQNSETLTLDTDFTVSNALFADRNAGTNKTVSATVALSNTARANNYEILPANNTLTINTGVINPLEVVISATGTNKEYDGTTTATVNLTATPNFISPDAPTFAYTATFDNANIGDGKTITVSGISLTGTGAENYSVANVGASTTTTANITRRALSWSTTGNTVNDKVYDGENTATVNNAPTLNGIIAGDNITVEAGTVVFNSVNVGTGIGITASDWAVGGTHAGNYTHPTAQPAFTAANITLRPITITPNAGQSKVFGQADPTFTYTSSEPLITGNSFSGALARAAGENIGTRAFNIGTLSAGNNYNITLNTANTFEITKRDIANVDIAAIANQAYTSNAIEPSLTVSDNAISPLGIATSDYDVSFSNNTNVGTATATITATLGGNYSGTKSANFEIIPHLDFATIVVSSTHTYDGTAQTPTFTARIGSFDLVEGTHFTTSLSNNTNAGTATITITGTGNYSGTKTETFTIAPKPLDINFTAANKVYDGNNSATITERTIVSGGLVGTYTATEIFVQGGTATFADVNAGTNNTVSATGFTLGGTRAGNYSIGTINTTTATISKAPLTVSAESRTIVFQDPLTPVLEATFSGFVGGETRATSDLSGTLTVATNPVYTQTSGVGTHETVPSGLTSNNYEITWVNGALTVGARPINGAGIATITVSSTHKDDGTPQIPEFSVVVNGTTLVAGTDFTAAFTDNINAGTATITITGTGNYSGTATQTFEIEQGGHPVVVSGFATGDPIRGFDNLTDALNSIQTEGAGTYTVTLFEDQEITALRTFNTPNTTITFEGDGGMRTITQNTAVGTNMFTISNASATISLGNDITLQGRTGATGGIGHIINMTNGIFNMLTGSRIIGHTAAGGGVAVNMTGGTFNMAAGSSITGHNASTATSAAVYLNNAGAIFNMDGGSITGNRNTTAVGTTNVGAGLTVFNGQFNMNGRSITGNTRGPNAEHSADVYIGATTLVNANLVPTLGGNAHIGTLIMNAQSATINTRIEIGNNFTGSVTALNLRSNNIGAILWENKVVLQGNVNSTTIGRFGLGEFVSSGNIRETISPTAYTIGASGDNLGRLISTTPPTVTVFNGTTTTGFSNLANAFASIATAGTYTVTLLADQTVETGMTLGTADVIINLYGAGRTITHNVAGNNLFSITNANATLSLRNNITLQGRSTTGAGSVVGISGNFIMEAGSRIIGHNATAAAVSVGGTFTMNGGSITGNRNTAAVTTTNAGAGVEVIIGQFNMNGGTITGNTRGPDYNQIPADVYIGATAGAAANRVPTLNGNAQIGTLTLNAQTNLINTRINVGPGFNGNVQTLDLRGQINTVLSVASWWESRTVLEGNVATNIGRFGLGSLFRIIMSDR